jgi:hypothetical protein
LGFAGGLRSVIHSSDVTNYRKTIGYTYRILNQSDRGFAYQSDRGLHTKVTVDNLRDSQGSEQDSTKVTVVFSGGKLVVGCGAAPSLVRLAHGR